MATTKIKTRAAIDWRFGENSKYQVIVDGRLVRETDSAIEAQDLVAKLRRVRRNADRRLRHQAYTDAGMTRVKGALGGTYYE